MSEHVEQPGHSAPETGEKIIPLSEIGKHKTAADLWMAINGKVYNVTKFADQHPGGEEVLLEHAGTDATTAFEDVGHSETAVEMLDDLYVGPGNPAELKIVIKEVNTEFGSEDESGHGKLLMLVAVLVSIAAYYYYKALQD